MINYYELGPHKLLNEIVMVGSHDAGVTFGKGNTQTQDLDIYEQAEAGVRFFDIRITAAVVKKGGAADVMALKAYHGKGPESKKAAINIRTGHTERAKVKSLWAGEYGMTLSKMLSDASKFVTKNNTEFLILKFDKCHNWPMIAEACVNVLGPDVIYTYSGTGDLNSKSLRELRGKVIVIFQEKGRQAVRQLYGPDQGILGFTNLWNGGAYKDDYPGLQYKGKGGTSIFKPFNKVEQNIKKQTKVMTATSRKVKSGKWYKRKTKIRVDDNPSIVGMMYWTTTGINESIRDRDSGMWTQPNVQRMQSMWNNGLESAIASRTDKLSRIDGFDKGAVLKAFMPNIVMIDFADPTKCKHIFELNTVPPTFLISSMQNFRLLDTATHG